MLDNRPGASGIIGNELGAKALPDGYTLLMGSGGPLTINPSLYAKLPDGQKRYNKTNERADAEREKFRQLGRVA